MRGNLAEVAYYIILYSWALAPIDFPAFSLVLSFPYVLSCKVDVGVLETGRQCPGPNQSEYLFYLLG